MLHDVRERVPHAVRGHVPRVLRGQEWPALYSSQWMVARLSSGNAPGVKVLDSVLVHGVSHRYMIDDSPAHHAQARRRGRERPVVAVVVREVRPVQAKVLQADRV